MEIWDYLEDVGASMRSLDEKRLLVAAAEGDDARVGSLWVVRGTRRNRLLVAAYPALFGARFPASSRAWIAALSDPAAPMPAAPGLVWTDVAGSGCVAWHRPARRVTVGDVRARRRAPGLVSGRAGRAHPLREPG